ncbi:MAG: hypothetical protein K8R45_03600 [Desulfobacterales bacterium]|nr:hypothetical protein [Desulfobacterales bacterium]
MKVNEVPQNKGMITDDLREICYAVDENGSYILAKSAGWEPKNIANDQAWSLIEEEISQTVKKIKAGKLSPLAFHMAKNQMNVSLLSKYVGFNRLRVKLHLKPSVFRKLKPSILKRYGRIFDIEVEELLKIPGLE